MLAKLPELGLRTQTTASRNIPQADKDLLAINISKQPVIALLTSPNEDEKLKGLKLLAAMYFSRRKVTEFLPYVVNIISNDLRIKRFVYFYLSNVCDSGRTEVLMSINSFHKDLTDNKPLARASALRAFSSLQLEEILPILMVSVQRAVADFSIYVRKAAALTLVKLYEWEDCDSNTLIELLSRLLTDACPVVLGAAVHALSLIAPERLDLIHSHFRRICREIDSFEVNYLPSVLNMMERYARTYLDKKVVQQNAEVDVDLKLLIEAAMNMLSLYSPAVVMAAAEIVYQFAPDIKHPKAINALLEYRGVRNEIGYLMLTLLYEFARKNSTHFQSISSYFYLNQTDEISLKKLKILSEIVTDYNLATILKELTSYTRYENPQIAVEAIQSIGRIVEKNSSMMEHCTKQLMILLKSHSPLVTSQAVIVIRKLLTQNPAQQRKIVVHCTLIIDSLHFPQARASAIWIIGKYYSLMPTLAVETMRKLVLNFSKETAVVKHQIINTLTKIFTEWKEEEALKLVLEKLFRFLLDLCFFDASYDIRDKGRLLKTIFTEESLKPVTELRLFEGEISIESNTVERNPYHVMSLSYLTDRRVEKYAVLWEDFDNPEALKETLMQDTKPFREEETAPRIRVEVSSHYSSQDIPKIGDTGLKTRFVAGDSKALEDFLDSEEEEEEEEEEGEEDEEDEEEEES